MLMNYISEDKLCIRKTMKTMLSLWQFTFLKYFYSLTNFFYFYFFNIMFLPEFLGANGAFVEKAMSNLK